MKDLLPALRKAQDAVMFRDAIRTGDLMRSPTGTLYRVKGFNELGEPELTEAIADDKIVDGTKYSTKGPSRYLAGWTLYTFKHDGLGRAIERLK